MMSASEEGVREKRGSKGGCVNFRVKVSSK